MIADIQQKPAFCATKLPWHEHPFRLISWLEMEKFIADKYFKIGSVLGSLIGALEQESGKSPRLEGAIISGWLSEITENCKSIGLIQSAKAAKHEHDTRRKNVTELSVSVDALRRLIENEMEEHLFLWVPPHRADFYSKDAEAIIGKDCCDRFPSIRREVEESVKCYAVGRYTASAFHLMRATEVCVKALAKAIKATPTHDSWRLVFEEMKNQVAIPFGNRQKHWKSHGDFLHTLWTDMCAVAKEWRNDLAHTVDTYTEEEAKQLLGVIPVFLRHGATKMDESGKLY